MTGGYATTGGSWEDPIYMFSQFGAFDGFHASHSLGFRCVRNTSNNDQGTMQIDLEKLTPSYTPVDEQTFKSFLSHYKYDRRPLDAKMIEEKDTADWIREKIAFVGVGGDRIMAYLYLPKRAARPFQCIVYAPGVSVFYSTRVSDQAELVLAPHIKSGRAVLAVVLKGAIEREWGADRAVPAPKSVQFREEIVLHATELSLGIDYLKTREDIDTEKLAYLGLSWGAGSRLGLAAVEPRYKSVILLAGGIDERMQPTQPEASNINFAPYIKPPKLLLNGKYDEEHPWFTRGLPLYNLLREPKKYVLVDGGHLPPVELRAPIINQWLDETLGSVKFQ